MSAISKSFGVCVISSRLLNKKKTMCLMHTTEQYWSELKAEVVPRLPVPPLPDAAFVPRTSLTPEARERKGSKVACSKRMIGNENFNANRLGGVAPSKVLGGKTPQPQQSHPRKKQQTQNGSGSGSGSGFLGANAGKGSGGRVVIDIVTGQKLVSVYFDPSQSAECAGNTLDNDWLGSNLYVPACVIKDDAGMYSVRLPSGDVYKVPAAGVSKVTDQDDEGVDDILRLKEFSEMSLIHTLRVRYARDDIYTFVGPILISINPYKWFKDLYSEQTMVEYHSKKQVRSSTTSATTRITKTS